MIGLLNGTTVAIAGEALVGRIAGFLLAEAGADVAWRGGEADVAIELRWCPDRPVVRAPIHVRVESGLDAAAEGLSEAEFEDRVGAAAGVFGTAISGQGGDGVAYHDVPVASVASAIQICAAIGAALWARGDRQITALMTRVPAFHKGTEFSDSDHLATVRATQLGASGLYRCADGRSVYLDAPSTRITLRLWRALGQPPELAALGVPLREVSEAQAHAISAALTETFAGRPAHEWERLLSTAGVPCGRCATRDEWQQSGRRGAPLLFRPAPGRIASEGRRLRALDLSTIIAGPSCARTLSALGFEVIKIEEPGEMPLWFPHLHIDAHRGKRHAVIDLRSSEGRDRFGELLGSTDVVVENARLGVWDRMGFGYEAWRELQPHLVIASVRLYGEGHHASGWPGYETTAQAVSGLMDRFGPIGGPPRRAGGGAINDYAAGSLATFGILSALKAGQPGHVIATLAGAASLFIDNAPAARRTGSVQMTGARDDATLKAELIAEERYRYADQPGWGRVGHVGYAVDFDPPLVDAWLPAPTWDEFNPMQQ